MKELTTLWELAETKNKTPKQTEGKLLLNEANTTPLLGCHQFRKSEIKEIVDRFKEKEIIILKKKHRHKKPMEQHDF